MNRLLENWIDGYIEYTANTESLEFFNRWVALSTIASALQKKAWLKLGRLQVFANMYVVLVADPGVARKTQSISYATGIMRNVSDINISSDSNTMQALLDNLDEAISYAALPDGTTIRHTSLSVISREFETFFTSGTSRLMGLLTDLFDCEFESWKVRTKSYGVIELPAVFLNILAATTPQSLRDCLSDLAIGGGLTSRVLFIFAKGKSKKVAIPEWTTRLEELKRYLSHDLARINSITGEFILTHDATEFWNTYYCDLVTDRCNRIAKNSAFDGWYSRKTLHILKVAMCLSAAKSGDMRITVDNLENAIKHIEEVEQYMGGIYDNTLTDIDEKTSLLMEHIRKRGKVTEMHLLHLVWRDMAEGEFDERIKELLRKQFITCTVDEANGSQQLVYELNKDVYNGSDAG